jgi:hypothetical protein
VLKSIPTKSKPREYHLYDDNGQEYAADDGVEFEKCHINPPDIPLACQQMFGHEQSQD